MNCHVTKSQTLKKLSWLGLTVLSGALLQPLHAQETLAGVGAASAAGAGLGAAAAGGISTDRFRRVNPGATNGDPTSPEFPTDPTAQGAQGVPGGTGGVAPSVVNTSPVAETFGANSRALVGQLLKPKVTTSPQPTRKRRTPRAQAAYSRRVSKLSPQARKRIVAQKYKIPPIGWRGAYLPQDRYKFAKAWKFVSTEDSQYYFTPEAMARRGFNANRVIGFRTWQDAMLAGYRPDPATRPAPGAQIASFASLTRGDGLYQYADYVYSGQVSPQNLEATYAYVQRVRATLSRTKEGRSYMSDTIDKVLQAAATGNVALIPRVIGQVQTTTTTNAFDPEGANPGIAPAPGDPALQGNPGFQSNPGFQGGPPAGFTAPTPNQPVVKSDGPR